MDYSIYDIKDTLSDVQWAISMVPHLQMSLMVERENIHVMLRWSTQKDYWLGVAQQNKACNDHNQRGW